MDIQIEVFGWSNPVAVNLWEEFLTCKSFYFYLLYVVYYSRIINK